METEKFKELEKVIERNDYKKLTVQLAEKCEELADLIMDKMLELDLYELDDLVIKTVKTYNGKTMDYLVIENDDGFNYYCSGALNYCSATHDNESGFYYKNDSRCFIKYAGNYFALHFVNKAKNYLRLLDDIETKKCEQIENALKNI